MCEGVGGDERLKQAWSADHVRLVREPRLGTYAGMPTLADQLGAGRREALVLYICGHGVSESGEAYLLCTDVARKTAAGGRELLRYPVNVVLEAVRDSPARLKLLILDATHLASDPWLGMFSNQFPRLLEEKLKALDDPRLWVLSAAGPLECSGVDYQAKQSVFSRFVEEGFQRAADKDGDGVVQLDEFIEYVRGRMAAWHGQQGGRSPIQTLWVWWCGGKQPSEASSNIRPPHELLFVLAKPRSEPKKAQEDKEPDDQAQAASAEPPESEQAKKALKAREDLAQVLEKAWAGRDGQQPKETDALDTWSPVDYAPHLWRWYEDQLLACQWRYCVDQGAKEALNQLGSSQAAKLLAGEKQAFLAGAVAKGFAGAPDEIRPVEEAARLRNRAVYFVRDYVRWHAAAMRTAVAPLAWHGQLLELMNKSLPALDNELAPLEAGAPLVPGSADLDARVQQVQEKARELQQALKRLRGEYLANEVRRAGGSPGAIEPLLSTPLLAGPDRRCRGDQLRDVLEAPSVERRLLPVRQRDQRLGRGRRGPHELRGRGRSLHGGKPTRRDRPPRRPRGSTR